MVQPSESCEVSRTARFSLKTFHPYSRDVSRTKEICHSNAMKGQLNEEEFVCRKRWDCYVMIPVGGGVACGP